MHYWSAHLYGGPRRVNHAAVAIGSAIFTFGGYCSGIDYNYFRPIDIHIFDTVKLKWLKLSRRFDQNTYDCVPFLRYGHTAVAHGTNIYLWGGRNDREVCNTLYCFDTNSLKWSKPLVSGNIPVPRDGHSACIIKDCIYIFGGYQEHPSQFSEDLYMLDLNTMIWSIIEPQGDYPSFRDFHSATAIGDKMYVFGGRGDEAAPRHSDKETYCDKVYYFDTTTKKWTCPPVSGMKPSGRRSHSAFEYKGKLYIFGGFNRILDVHFQDIYQYDPQNSTWKIMISKGTPPCARRRQICIVINDKVYISGGTSPLSSGRAIGPKLQGLSLEDQLLSNLRDHGDLHVLDLNPSLKDMCLVNVWDCVQKKQIKIQNISLPLKLIKDLETANPLKEDQGGPI